MNLLNIIKEASNHATPFGFGEQVRGIDIAERFLATDLDREVTKDAATVVAPEFAAITRPLIDKFSTDAQENQITAKYATAQQAIDCMEAQKDDLADLLKTLREEASTQNTKSFAR